MREIKFRAKGIRENKDKWFVGSLFVEDGMGITYIVSGVNTHYETNYLQVEVASETVGQFTGLRDCKGQEIFEGDILRYLPPWRWVDTKRIGVVVFQNYGFYVKNEYVTDSLFNIAVNSDGAPFEVIGNVHDNPELLEVEA